MDFHVAVSVPFEPWLAMRCNLCNIGSKQYQTDDTREMVDHAKEVHDVHLEVDD